jgi:DNA-binding GntR family transcriptional regulator
MAADELRNAIITGKFAPGEHITEASAAKHLGVSRIVVREAMLILMHEGLINKESKRYTSVAEFTKKSVNDVHDIREALELIAAKKCAGNPKAIAALRSKSEEIEELNNKKNPKKEKLLEKEMEFHNLLIASADNQRLFEMWNNIIGQISMLLYRYLAAITLEQNSHAGVIKALESGDQELIRNTMIKHINDTRYMLLDILSAEEKNDGKARAVSKQK